MSSIFQGPLVSNESGRVNLLPMATDERPVGALDFRGLVISPTGSVMSLPDGGEPRIFHNGMALTQAAGLLLTSSGPVANICSGGLAVDAAGAVVIDDTNAPDVIHQGVGLKNDGALATELGVGTVVPDNLWTIEQPATCDITNGVITWNRITADSFIYLNKPPSYSPGQNWVVSYEVIENSGIGVFNGIFCSSQGSLLPGTGITTALGKQGYESVGVGNPLLLRWTPQNTFNGQTLQIRDVRLYDKNNPGAYP